MKKSLIALAALAATASFAQSSVTISGYLGASFDAASVSGATTARTGNTSETRVSDQSSRIIFGLVEDLGGGLRPSVSTTCASTWTLLHVISPKQLLTPL